VVGELPTLELVSVLESCLEVPVAGAIRALC
jgi:hypothetical protein